MDPKLDSGHILGGDHVSVGPDKPPPPFRLMEDPGPPRNPKKKTTFFFLRCIAPEFFFVSILAYFSRRIWKTRFLGFFKSQKNSAFFFPGRESNPPFRWCPDHSLLACSFRNLVDLLPGQRQKNVLAAASLVRDKHSWLLNRDGRLLGGKGPAWTQMNNATPVLVVRLLHKGSHSNPGGVD